jgi:hypothetical protein
MFSSQGNWTRITHMQHIKRVGELRRRAAELSLLLQSVTTPAIRSQLSREATELLYTADRLARVSQLPERTELPRRPEPVALVDAQRRMERTERAASICFVAWVPTRRFATAW